MEKPAQNIQDSFLNNARKDKIVLTIYLMSGVKRTEAASSLSRASLARPNKPASRSDPDPPVDRPNLSKDYLAGEA